jgi:hypothetical protein
MSCAITRMRHGLLAVVSILGALTLATSITVTSAMSSPGRWYPAGYRTSARYPGIAARWDHSPHCSYDASCMGLYVVSRRGCPNGLYAEMNIVSRGAVVSYTNDSLGFLRPRQIARLTFNVYDLPAGATGQLTKIDCL